MYRDLIETNSTSNNNNNNTIIPYKKIYSFLLTKFFPVLILNC